MYHSHPLESAYGQPGYFVAKPTGTVRDSSGRAADLTPDASERYARRLLIRTSELPPPVRGVYRADIRKAKNVSAIKLAHASIPRPITRATAQLTLFSIPIRHDPVKEIDRAYQRFSRNQLLSKDTADYPFFDVTRQITNPQDHSNRPRFDWRNNDHQSFAWTQQSEKNTEITDEILPAHSNQELDMDVLTVKVPFDCTLSELGNTFRQALAAHCGTGDQTSNSLWKQYAINVTDSGFSVVQQIPNADHFNTFAAVRRHDEFDNVGSEDQGSSLEYAKLKTPFTIRLKKATSVFVDKKVLDGSGSAPTGVMGTQALLREFTPHPVEGADDLWEVSVESGSTDDRYVQSVTFREDITAGDILSVQATSFRALSNLTGGATVTTVSNGFVSIPVTGDDPSEFDLTRALTISTGDSSIEESNFAVDSNTILLPGSYSSATYTSVSGETIAITQFTTFEQKGLYTTLVPVARTYQKQRDVRLGLKWEGRTASSDFFIDAAEEYDSPLENGVRRDVNTMKQLTSETMNDQIYDGLRTTAELQGTFIEGAMASGDQETPELYNLREQNDAQQMRGLLYAGLVMNVEAPTKMKETQIPGDIAERPTQAGYLKEFYTAGLGWQTSITHDPSRYVMSAFPVRNTQRELHDASRQSVYGGEKRNTSISPLVARILNPELMTGSANTRPYYDVKLEDGTLLPSVSDLYHDTNNGGTFNQLTYYAPRDDNKALAVSIGDQNYVVRSARPVSVLRNNTSYTLDLSSSTNEPAPLEPFDHKRYTDLYNEKQDSINPPDPPRDPPARETSVINAELDKLRHAFYRNEADNSSKYQLKCNAEYFCWVFELDREVKVESGISEAHAATPAHAVTPRTFDGVNSRAAMFLPSVFHKDTGRCAPTHIQQTPHAFFVRSGASPTDQTLVVLHGMGNIERPLNSNANNDHGDVFAVLGNDMDHKKTLGAVCEQTTWFRNPDSLSRLQFSFMSARTGKIVDVGNQNATLLIDIYAENE